MSKLGSEEGARPGRNRIVINIDDGKKGRGFFARANGGGGRRTLAIVALVLLIIALSLIAGLYFWWQSYKLKPAYSLALMVDAVERNDRQAFDEIVDTDKIIENFAPQLAEKAGGLYPQGLSAALRRQVEAAIPRLTARVKERVREEITAQIKELSSRGAGKPFVLVALGLPFVADIKEEGERATVKANLRGRPVELTMQHSGERWRVVAVRDEALAARILDQIAKDLPAASAPAAVPDVRREIRRRLPPGLPEIPLIDEK